MKYRGYTLSNVSDDPRTPLYGVFAPDGERVDTLWFPSEFKQTVNRIIKTKSNEVQRL